MPHSDPQILQIVVASIVSVTLLLQVILLIAILIGVRKAAAAAREDLEDIRSAVTPLINETRELLVRVGPKIEATTTDLAAFTHALRGQTATMQATVTEISDRARHQAGRIDFIITSALDTAERASALMTDAVTKPMRQLTGALAWLKAVVETLRAPEVQPPKPPVEGTQGDSGMFV